MLKSCNIISILMALMLTMQAIIIQAQTDSLPKFLLTERNGYVIVGWNNSYPEITQLIIQRSTDSVTGFRSIMSMPDPNAKSNGFIDKKGGTSSMFYRLMIVLPGGRYNFTEAKKPLITSISLTNNSQERDDSLLPDKDKRKNHGKHALVKKIESDQAARDNEKRNLITKTNILPRIDILETINKFHPSTFIFTNEEGNLILLLPDAEKRHYHLHVFREDGRVQFKMRNIKERHLTVDRSNFYQSGWFLFELYDGELLKEKNRFFIPPESR